MAGAIDLFSGARPISGTNKMKVDKSPLDQLDSGIENVIGQHASNAGIPFLSLFQSLVDALLLLPQSSQPVTGVQGGSVVEVYQFFGGLMNFLGGLNPLDPDFDIAAAAENFIEMILQPAELLAPLVDGFLPFEYLNIEALIEAILDRLDLGGLLEAIQELVDLLKPRAASIVTRSGDGPPDPTGLPDGTLWFEV